MARAVGLDVGTKTLKLVELSGSAKAFKVTRLIVRDLPDGEGEEGAAARADAIRKAFSEAKVGRDDVCASFDAGSAIFREVQVPFRERDQIAKVIPFEAENHLHGRAIEDVVVNWAKIADTKDGSQVLVIATPKVDLAEDLGILRRAGIEPASVDLDATALFTACEASGVFVETPSVVLVEIGARTTNLILVDGGQLRSIRSFLVGSESLSTALQQDLSLPPGEGTARALKPGPNDPEALLVPVSRLATATRETAKSARELEEDVTVQRRDDFIRKLHREITRSLASTRSDTPAEKVLLSGGGSLLPGLRETLAERLEMPVEPLDILGRVGFRPSGPRPELEAAVSAVAIGCGLRLLGANPLLIELRRDEFAPTNTFEVVRTALATALTLLVALLAGLTFVTKETVDREKTVYLGPKSVCSQAATIFKEIESRYQEDVKGKSAAEAATEESRQRKNLPNDPGYLSAVRNHMLRRYRELENDLGISKDFPRIESALKVWREIMLAFNGLDRAALGWLKLTKLQINPNSASITIEIEDERNLDKIVGALAANEYLKGRAKEPQRPWEKGPFTRQQSGKFTGNIDIKFQE